ncbi:YegS/Rv2252/BmrU family lipid kinase [Nocardioides seonyuensis]|uniref:YegS/Rv2252/BmrU family lipid kinase n=1 Tax=Nocardioides seonyuensis TaxID=2518371 RepID=A0A4P7IIQ3_9ACTN|nr:YegS/Rv2252/BmrU family lipid kinase [Nocardioides seonyuensis]QBX55761.1 YegS/Rv2252/BmrU family lipid kinase [Nocardioides seonyuensis]
MDPLLVITNSDAGTSDQETLEQALVILREAGSVEVTGTSNPGELDGVLHRAGSRTIVVAGGDGSLHAVVQALHKRNELADATLALLPLGTGNDFARGTDIPLDIEEAARLVVKGKARPVDLILDETGSVVVNNVHVGVGAQASRKGKKWKERLGSVGVGKVNLGKAGYPIGALMSAFHPPHRRLRVEVDGEVVNDLDQPVLMVAIGNGAAIGGGTEITPDADPEDRRLDVMISRSVSPAAKLGYVARLRRGEHLERDDVLSMTGHTVSVSGEEFWVSADGELYGPERHRTWRIEPAAYRMVLPALHLTRGGG